MFKFCILAYFLYANDIFLANNYMTTVFTDPKQCYPAVDYKLADIIAIPGDAPGTFWCFKKSEILADKTYNPDSGTFTNPYTGKPVTLSESDRALLKELPPACQLREDPRPDQRYKKCQAALLDNTEQKILIVYEKSYPVHLRRWGLPKGKFKVGEQATECVHREVCEEVGIEVSKYPHKYRKKDKNQIIIFDRPAEEIELKVGPEILEAKWVDLGWLKNDIKQDSDAGLKVPKGQYNYKYNLDIRTFVPRI